MGYEGSQKDRAIEVNMLRESADRLLLFVKKMVEDSLLSSGTGPNTGYLERRKRFKKAVIMLKAP